MAINFGRMARGVATGYLSAKIANTEAYDKLKGDIHKAAGINFYTNTYPEWQKKERVREREFKQVSNFFESDAIANFWGDQGAITGDGKSLNTILATLKAKNLNPNDFKKDFKWEGSTYEERKAERFTDIQDTEKIATSLSTGSSKIGPMTAESQLEGTVTDKITPSAIDTGVEPVGGILPGGEKELSIAQVTQPEIAKKTRLSDIYGAAVGERGVETKFNAISKAVNEQMGYGEAFYNAQDGTTRWNIANDLKKISNAHIAIASNITGKDSTINQLDAVSLAKQELDRQTYTPFQMIASALSQLPEFTNVKYTEGAGKQKALFIGAGPSIDATTTMIGDQSIYNFLTDIYTNDLMRQDGDVSTLVLEKFVENIPQNLMIKTKSGNEKLSEVILNSHRLHYFKKLR